MKGGEKHSVTHYLRKLFAPILRPFEKGSEPFVYKPLNRKILLVVGVLFCGLGLTVTWIIFNRSAYGYFLPAVVFLGAGCVCLVVGALGSDRAIAKIWGSR